jgi:hypothetical protein
LRVVPTFRLAHGGYGPSALRMFRCVSSAWAVAAYPGYRDRLASAALNAFKSVGPNAQGLQRSESAAIAAVAAASYHQEEDGISPGLAVSSAIDAAAQNGGKKGFEEVLDILARDAAFLDQGIAPVSLANGQLWPSPRTPDWVNDGWEALKLRLLAADENWDVWISWYEDRMFGNTTDTALEVARAADVPESVWKEGPKSANAFIRQLRGMHLKHGTEDPPDPGNKFAFHEWLSAKPREWATVIAARAALRLLATLGASPGDTTLLSIFRAISASRYAVMHPELTRVASHAAAFLRGRTTQMTIAAFYAASAAGAEDAPSRAITISDLGHGLEPTGTAAILGDAFALVRGTPPQALARAPLWRPANEGGTPPAVRRAWRNLAQVLGDNSRHWQVWIDWYDYVLEGSPSAAQRDDAWEAAFVDVPTQLPWDAGAESVNTEIAARLRSYVLLGETVRLNEIEPPQIPTQGYGPHFEIGENGVINFAPPQALDRQGNNVVRLAKLHPILLALSSDLVEALGHGNLPHRYLRDRAEAYRAIIDQSIESVDFARLYVEGVRLANAMRAALADEELPRLEHPIQESLDSLLQLHGTFVLETVEGIEIIAAEERYRRTPQEELEYRAAAVSFAKSLQDEPGLIDPKAASFVLETAEEIGRGANPERSGAVASGTVKNVAIVVSTAGALGALFSAAVASGSPALIVGSAVSALVFGEGLKRSKAFAAVAGLITRGLDRASETDIASIVSTIRERFRPQLKLVLRIEPQLRRLATQHDEFNWLNRTLDWIKQRELELEDKDQKPKAPST